MRIEDVRVLGCGRAGSLVKRALRAVFGARGQLVVGIVALCTSIAAWVYGAGLRGEALLHFLVHVSMAALVLASYAIIATALGYRATERVEQVVLASSDETV